MMRNLPSFVAFLALSLVVGCGESESQGPPFIDDTTFEFQLGQGSGWHGLDLLKLTADGQAVYDYQERRGQWLRKRFPVDKARLEALLTKIDELKIHDLDKAYQGGVADGTQWCILIKSKGKSKAIYCDNKFPEPIQNLATFVGQTIIEPLGGPVQPSALSQGEHRRFEKEIWDSIQ